MMNTSAGEDDPSNTAGARSAGGAQRNVPLLDNCIDSRSLFVTTKEITIAHGDEVYRLRLTAQNKLILTK